MLDPKVVKEAQQQLTETSASNFNKAPSHAWIGVPGYGVLHTVDSNPISLMINAAEGVGYLWKDVPVDHQRTILAYLEGKWGRTSRGTVTVTHIDKESQTLYFGEAKKDDDPYAMKEHL